MALFAVAWPSVAAARASAKKPRAAAKPSAGRRVSGRASKRKPLALTRSRSRSRSHSGSARVSAAPRKSFQQAPTPERYKEIQQALAGRGYFKGPADGQWGADSVEALKRFQSNQNLEPDGKLGSLSLIALGLGPKRLTAQSAPPAGESK